MEERRQQLIKALGEKNVEYCLNSVEYDKNKLQYIVVGDNPGITEIEKGEYFRGKSGQELRSILTEVLPLTSVDEECYVANKSWLHTAKTAELSEVRKEIGSKLFNDLQLCIAEEIITLATDKKLPVLLFGMSELKLGGLFEVFFRALVKAKVDLYVFKHPSRGHLRNDVTELLSEVNQEVKLDKFLSLGKNGLENIQVRCSLEGARFFYAPAVYATWPKLFVLLKSGYLYTEYLDYWRTKKEEKHVEPTTFSVEKFRWRGYQRIKEITFEEAISAKLVSQKNWVETFIDKVQLNPEMELISK